MTEKDLVNYWKTTAKEALVVAEDLYSSKHYDFCLFFCQLSLEKLIKGLVVKHTGKEAPPIHDLVKLIKNTGIKALKKEMLELKEITLWNITARYDTIKRAFYKKATKEFTLKWFKRVKEIYLWLEKQY